MRHRHLLNALSITLAACLIATTAGAADPIRMLVLNMHAGKDASGRPNLDAIATLVKDQKPDLVLLQEVDRGTNRSGQVDQIAVLSKSTKYQSAFAPSLLNYDGGEYGIALLSRGLIGYRAATPLPVLPAETRAGGSHEARVAQVAIVVVRGTTWRVLNAHLDPSNDGGRPQEIAALVHTIHQQQVAGTPLVAGGDFNATPDDPVLQPIRAAGLHDAWVECGSGDGFTYPADNPTKRIDYLWMSEGMRCASAEVLDAQISDHRPLMVTLK